MERRTALKLTTSIIGGTLIGSEVFLSGCASVEENQELFSEADVLFLDEVGETILPASDRSPGAKAAKIGLFMKTMVSDCYDEKEQAIFKAGIPAINELAQENYSNDFIGLSPAQKQELLAVLDEGIKNIPEGAETPYFAMMKQLSIWGYFTSEPGATKALRYNPLPGEFKGCIPYHIGDKAWA